ncbi:MAG: hypothetical protein ABIS50_22445 [Luteolibacter sp.]|uniref:hypothetical protein n=1 Tax=Luteolibacter sp. TaxID=1962973 RepID=UPI003262DC71
MNRLIFAFFLLAASLAVAQENLRPSLETTYNAWRESMIRHDAALWQRVTAEHRKMEIKNRIISEKQPFPATVFNLPAAPPALQGLKFLEAKQNGATAKVSYYGKVNFGVAEPSDNLLVLSFIKGSGGWLYDRADFVNLVGLPEVKKELAAGDIKYLKETPEAQPSGQVPPTPLAAHPAKYVAKVYVFGPGREVKVQINKISQHRFVNMKDAEVVIGGALDGPNEIQYSIKKLEGGTGKEALTIRVYLRAEAAGVEPLKVYQYQVAEGETPKPFGTETFNVDAATVAKITGH